MCISNRKLNSAKEIKDFSDNQRKVIRTLLEYKTDWQDDIRPQAEDLWALRQM